jgi:hypothetical protein
MIEHEHHSHTHRTGLPWLDLIVAGSAIVISVASLVISINHGRTMERLVEANEKQVEATTLPVLRFSTGNITDGARVIHFDLRNGGTGPAMIQWLRIKWKGEPTTGPADLFDRCCRGASHREVPIGRNIASGMTLPAGQSETVFYVRAADADAEFYQRLDTDARFKMDAEACFCSVLDDCWMMTFNTRPTKVKACERIPENQRW